MKPMENKNLNILSISRAESGFSLIEIMIVVAIIGLLGTLITKGVSSRLDKARVETTKNQMRNIGSQLDTFKIDCGFYPGALKSLMEKPTEGQECKNYDPSGYTGGKPVAKDAWGNDFWFESDGSKYVIKSYGQDGKEGGDGIKADLSSDDI